MSQTNECPKAAPKLTVVEQKLLQQIQAQAPQKSSWVKFVSNTVCGFYY